MLVKTIRNVYVLKESQSLISYIYIYISKLSNILTKKGQALEYTKERKTKNR